MHYANGRESKVGDRVVGQDWAGNPMSGVVVNAILGSEAFNIYVVPIPPGGMPVYSSGMFVHLEDALSAPASSNTVPAVTGEIVAEPPTSVSDTDPVASQAESGPVS